MTTMPSEGLRLGPVLRAGWRIVEVALSVNGERAVVDVLQHPTHDLAGRRGGYRGDELHSAWQLVCRQVLAAVGYEVCA